jgi:hypothetical protein
MFFLILSLIPTYYPSLSTKRAAQIFLLLFQLPLISKIKPKYYLGEVPQGKPHASNVREEDIELVDAEFDRDGNVVAGGGGGGHSGFAGRPEDEVS